MVVWLRDRPRLFLAVVVLAVSLVLGAAFVLYRAMPSSEETFCRHLYSERIGHDPADVGFWSQLVVCAQKGELQDGANNPDFYR